MIHRFLLGILVFSLLWSAIGWGKTRSSSAVIPFWPTEVAQCEPYTEFTCQYLLCLCFLNTTAPGLFQPDERNQSICNSRYSTCELESKKG